MISVVIRGRKPMIASGFVVSALFGIALLSAELPVSAAPSVLVKSGVNCPGIYVKAGRGKNCQAAPEYVDIIYLGENTRESCKPTYTRLNAGDSKWCVKYSEQY